MLKGIERIVARAHLEIGKFYFMRLMGDSPDIIQIVGHKTDGGDIQELGIIYPSDSSVITIGEIPSVEIYAEISNVAVRVDPTSMAGTNYEAAPRCGMFLISEQNAIFLARPPRGVGWQSVSITESATVDLLTVREWCSFSRWTLVSGDGDEERALYPLPTLDPTPIHS